MQRRGTQPGPSTVRTFLRTLLPPKTSAEGFVAHCQTAGTEEFITWETGGTGKLRYGWSFEGVLASVTREQSSSEWEALGEVQGLRLENKRMAQICFGVPSGRALSRPLGPILGDLSGVPGRLQ